MGRLTSRVPLVRVTVAEDGTATTIRRPDTLAAEEPLEIRVGGEPISVTMRTPGHDFELVAGFLVTEGIISSGEHIRAQRYCAGAVEEGVNTYNVVDVTVTVPVVPRDVARSFYTTSSCGICGKASIDAIRARSAFPLVPPADGRPVDPAVVVALPDRLRAAQRLFDDTGGLHAAGLFDPDGTLLCVREDVGRHNAVDKVVGWALTQGRLPLRDTVLQVSGRASFELVQKAHLAGIPVLSAVSAPSSLAVELAEEVGMTLLGFVRPPTFNVYTGAERVRSAREASAVAEGAELRPAS